MRTRTAWGLGPNHASGKPLSSSTELQKEQQSMLPARRGGRDDELLLRRAERASRQQMPRSTIARMFGGHVSSWNLRDRHMVETFEAFARTSVDGVGRLKIVVWEHNSHVGDARATRNGR